MARDAAMAIEYISDEDDWEDEEDENDGESDDDE